MSDSIICERSFVFACRILKLCDALWRRGPSGRHLASELIKCGTSIGANAEEAQEGQTKPDYIAKMAVSRKESRETRYWLRLAAASDVATQEEIAWELEESNQLLTMIRKAIRTAQSSTSRG